MSDISHQFANLEVNIKTYHGNYVRARVDKDWVDLTTNSPRNWEKIRIIETDQGGIAFQACDGRYICSQWGKDNWGIKLTNWVKSWEIHQIVKDGNKVNIYVPHHRKYWCAIGKGDAGEIRARADKPLRWEEFTLEIVTNTAELNIPTTINIVCCNNQEIEENLISLNPKPYCRISDKKWTYIEDKMKMKPIFAYLKYIGKNSIPDGVEQTHTFEKQKGIVKSWSINVGIRQKISANFLAVESETEISLGFNYGKKISEVTTETWQERVTGPAEFVVFQPVIIFAVHQESPKGTKLMHILKDSPLTLNQTGKQPLKAVTSNQAEWIVSKNRSQWKGLELLSLNI